MCINIECVDYENFPDGYLILDRMILSEYFQY